MLKPKLRGPPILPKHLEKEFGNYIVGVQNVRTLFYFPYGDVYIKHFIEKTVKRWQPILEHPFRIAREKITELDYHFLISDVPLAYGNCTVDEIKTSIEKIYGMTIENIVLSELLDPLLKQYEDYYNQIKGK